MGRAAPAHCPLAGCQGPSPGGGAAGSRVAPADHTVSHTTWDQAPRCCFLPVIWWLLAATYCVPLGTLCTAVTTLTDQVLTEGPGR